MARPTKQGIDYFPLDTSPDSKIDLFIASCGAEGYGILIVLWQVIYREDGYFVKYDNDLFLILRRYTLSSVETIVSIIVNAIDRGIFSKKIADNYKVLTSSGIQKRYFTAAKQKKSVITVRKYLLVDISMFKNLVSINGNRIVSNGNATKVEVEVEVEVKEEGITQQADSVIDYLNEKTNKNFKHSSASREPIIARLNDKATIDECKMVIDNKISDEDFKLKYLQPSTLFRKSNFENYLNQSVAILSQSTGKTTCDSCLTFCIPNSPDKCNKRGNMEACNDYAKRTTA